MSAHELAIHIGSMVGAGLGAFLGQLFQRAKTRQLADIDALQEVKLRELETRITILEHRKRNGHGG